MRVRRLACLALVALAAVGARAHSATGDTSRDVMVVGDSVATGMLWHPEAVAAMQFELEVDWQIAICRTIAGQSCPFDGERPATLVDLVHSLGTVPPIVVVELGYNDPLPTFAADLDAGMSALVAAGAKHVVWLTLHEIDDTYAAANRLLEQGTRRWPELQLVDWNAYVDGHPSWFQSDGVHLVASGGLAMAHFAHAAVMQIVDPLRVVGGPHIRLGRAYDLRLRAAGGAPPYRWRIAAGRPPRGFHLLANGRVVTARLSGRPTTFSIGVTDADGATAELRLAAA